MEGGALEEEQAEAAVQEVLTELITSMRRSDSVTWLDALQSSPQYLEVRLLTKK